MVKTAISTEAAPSPAAAYSQAVRKGNLLQVSGQVGIDPSSATLVEGVAEQTRQTFRNLIAILRAAGSSMDDVIMLRVYLADPSDFAEMNKAFEEFVTQPYPARTTVGTGLQPGILVEIDALAVVGD
jgi:2-iminobutanoate/2-iminopropanoate deaminase